MTMSLFAFPPVLGQLIPRLSIERDADNERLAKDDVQEIFDPAGENNFTLELWFKCTDLTAANQRIIEFASGSQTRVFVGLDAASSGDLRFSLITSAGTVVKAGTYAAAFTVDTWHHLVLNYYLVSAGPTVRDVVIWLDGVDLGFEAGGGSWSAPDHIDTNSAAFAGATNCSVCIGESFSAGTLNWRGNFFSAAMWYSGPTSAFSSSAVAALFANPRKDRRLTFGGYDGSTRDTLAHYWCPALTWDGGTGADSSLGEDVGLVGTAANIMDDATNITDADLLGDAP